MRNFYVFLKWWINKMLEGSLLKPPGPRVTVQEISTPLIITSLVTPCYRCRKCLINRRLTIIAKKRKRKNFPPVEYFVHQDLFWFSPFFHRKMFWFVFLSPLVHIFMEKYNPFCRKICNFEKKKSFWI